MRYAKTLFFFNGVVGHDKSVTIFTSYTPRSYAIDGDQ